MNAGAVDQSIAVAMQSGTHAARPADTASCAASSHVSLAGPAGSLPVHAWYWSMQPPPRSVAATFRDSAHHITFRRGRRALRERKVPLLVIVGDFIFSSPFQALPGALRKSGFTPHRPVAAWPHG